MVSSSSRRFTTLRHYQSSSTIRTIVAVGLCLSALVGGYIVHIGRPSFDCLIVEFTKKKKNCVYLLRL